jgi:hypothetical protein
MPLSPTQHARFARHTLLPEIGVTGQERLCSATVVADPSADVEAVAVARDYLQRAGVTVATNASQAAAQVAEQAFHVDAATTVDARGPLHLRHAAAALTGAFAAVEAIKAITAVGQAASLPGDFRLVSEEA